MCLKFFKKKQVEPLYPNEITPDMTVQEVIDELEYDIEIHEYWAVKVTESPAYAPSMGDYDWHLDWILTYRAAIYYLEKLL